MSEFAMGWAVQMLITRVWPTPIGLGARAMYAWSVIVHAGVCALAVGISIIEADIESIRNIAIAIAAILFFSIFLSPDFYFFRLKKQRNASYPI
jgi:hypothetical protein